jgi:uncharacterized protein (DUF924 family)
MKEATQSKDVLDFWFGEVDSSGMSSQTQQQLWFNPPPGTDEAIRARFGHAVEMALAGRLDDWAATPGGLTALVVLLDQFTRNIFRGSAAAYSGDTRALTLARLAVARNWPATLPTIYRVFLCMPFEHAEELEAQDEGLTCIDVLLSECGDSARPRIADFRRYMAAHRDVIARFGRFPHRNHILGRTTTAEESVYLEKHGGF